MRNRILHSFTLILACLAIAPVVYGIGWVRSLEGAVTGTYPNSSSSAPASALVEPEYSSAPAVLGVETDVSLPGTEIVDEFWEWAWGAPPPAVDGRGYWPHPVGGTANEFTLEGYTYIGQDDPVSAGEISFVSTGWHNVGSYTDVQFDEGTGYFYMNTIALSLVSGTVTNVNGDSRPIVGMASYTAIECLDQPSAVAVAEHFEFGLHMSSIGDATTYAADSAAWINGEYGPGDYDMVTVGDSNELQPCYIGGSGGSSIQQCLCACAATYNEDLARCADAFKASLIVCAIGAIAIFFGCFGLVCSTVSLPLFPVCMAKCVAKLGAWLLGGCAIATLLLSLTICRVAAYWTYNRCKANCFRP